MQNENEKAKVFSWKNYVKENLSNFKKFSDFLDFINDNASDIKHLVKKDRKFVEEFDGENDTNYLKDVYFTGNEDKKDNVVKKELTENEKAFYSSRIDTLLDILIDTLNEISR